MQLVIGKLLNRIIYNWHFEYIKIFKIALLQDKNYFIIFNKFN